MKHHFLCHLNEMDDLSSKNIEITLDDSTVELFIVRKNNDVYCYRNHCPHTGVNLNWQPDQFLDYANHYIQCSTHGALFRINDGFCVSGPCAGDSLQPLAIFTKDHQLFVEIM